MSATIDSLDIEISASVQSANKSLDALVSRLGKVSASLGSLNGNNGLKNLSASIVSLANASGQFKQNVSVSSYSNLAKSLTNLANVNSTNISNISSSIQQLSGAMTTIGSVGADMSGLTNFANSLSKLGGLKVTSATSNIMQLKDVLGQFVGTMNTVQGLTFDPAGITNLANSLARLGGKNVTQAVSNLNSMNGPLRTFINNMNSFGSLTFDSSNLFNFANAIARMGGKSATQAITNLPRLTKEFKNLIITVSRLPQVSENIIRFTNSLSQLASQGQSMSSATRSIANGLKSFNVGTSSASLKSFSLASAIGKLYAKFWLLLRLFRGIGKSIDYSSQLTEVQNVVDNTFGPYADRLQEMADKSIELMGISELATKRTASTFQAMGKALGFAQGDMAEMSMSLTQLSADMASFYDQNQEDVAEKLKSIFTGTTKPLREFGIDLTQATVKEWALANGLDANFKNMTQLEKAALRYKYVMAQTTTAQGDFARTANTWANQVRILKQNFVELANVIGRSFVAMLKPLVRALNVAIGYIIQFAELVSNALGKLFGWEFDSAGGGSIEDVMDGLEEGAEGLSDGVGSAADNAKKLKQQLQGIDELNNLTSNKNDGGSGGSGGTGGGGLGNQELWQTKESIFDFFNSEIESLYELGATIGTTISNALNSIDWNKVYDAAIGFGSGLASFLNGLISPELFGTVAKTIANSLNTAIYTVLAFGEEFDFYNLGSSIAESVNQFFDNFDFIALAKTINTWVHGIEDTLISAIAEVNWMNVIKGAFNFLTTLDVDVVAIAIGSFLWKYKGKEIVAGALANLLQSQIALGIGSGTISVSAAIGLTLVAAYVGWKIGTWAYEHVGVVQKASDAIADWLVEDNGEVNITKTISVTGIALAFAFTTAKLSTWIGTSIASIASAGIDLAAIGGAIKLVGLKLELAGTNLLIALSEWVSTVAIPTITTFFSTTLPEMLAGAASLSIPTIAIGAITFAATFAIAFPLFNKLYDESTGFEEITDWIVGNIASIFTGDDLGVTLPFQLKFEAFLDDSGIGEIIVALTDKEFWKSIPETWFEIGQNIGTKLIEGIGDIKTKITEKFDEVKSKTIDIKTKLTEAADSNAIISWFINKIKNASEITKKIAASLKNSENSNSIIYWFVSKIQGAKDITKKIAAKLSNDKDSNSVIYWLISKLQAGASLVKTVSVTVKTTGDKVLQNIKNIWDKLVSKTVKLDLNFSAMVTDLKSWLNTNVIDKINNVFRNVPILKNHLIPRFANGGFPDNGRGSLFIAGEAGPEIVAKSSRGSEVLNKSQIASAMYNSVENANAETNKLLRQQNELLQSLLEKESGISYKEVFEATRTANNEFKAINGVSALA